MEHLGGVNFHGRPQYDSDGLITSSEVDTISGSLQTNIDEKSNNDHIHDDRYYTESEVDTISGTLSAEIDSDIAAHTSNADAHHTESHIIVSHSDTTATGANLNELVGGGDTTLHKHDGQYYTESEVDTISGSLQTNIDGKPDTEVFLVEGVPSGAIGKENDIAVDQETGDIYEKCSSSNYTTYNPSDKGSQVVLSNGNLTATNSASFDAASVRSVLGKLSGKYYWEVTIGQSVTGYIKIGIGNSSANIEDFPGKNTNSYGYGAGGAKHYNDTWQEYGDSFTEGDTVSIALDMDNGKVWWAKNGVWQASGDPASGTNEAYSGINGTFYSMDCPGFTSGESVTANFGVSSFLYSVPSGFTAGLCVVTEVEWSKKLSPDFLKLSDTPSTYSEVADKYLKTTTSGIEFSDDELYTKSEVDTISGSLQTNIDGKSDTSHIHDDRYYTESEVDDLITTISGKLDDHNELNNLDYASSGHTGFQPSGDYATTSELVTTSGTLQTDINRVSDFINYADSPMIVTGGTISSGTNVGTFKVSSLTALLRETVSSTSELKYVTKSEEDNISIPLQDTTYFIILNYNSGNPTISISVSPPNLTQDIAIGFVMKNSSNIIHSINCGFRFQAGVFKTHQRAKTLRDLELASGGVIAYSGTDNFTMTSSVTYGGINRFTLGPYDSAVTAFTYIHQDGGGGWTETPSNTIDYSHYDDGDGTLGNVGNAKYSCHWVYTHSDDGDVYVVYGLDSYSIAEAEASLEPNHPDHLNTFGCLIGRIVTPQVGGSFTSIQMVTDRFFTGTSVAVHNDLGGLNVGDYKHLTATNHTDLTDGNDCSIHTHGDLYYTEGEVDTISGSLQTNIDGKSDTGHTHDDRYYTEGEIDTISGSLQTNIDGKSDTGHTHDDRYYTESEVDTISGSLNTKIDGKSAISHIHDDRYYTETELNAGQLDNRYYIESEVDTISGSLQINIDGKADVSHIHDDRYYTESEVDDLITTISGTLGDHSGLNNLDYASSGHTGFQPAGDYLTDSEFSTYSGTLQNNIDSHASNHTDGTDDIQSATNTQKGLATSAQIISIEANTAHKTSTGADHSYIDQTVVSGTDPTFVGTNITEIPSTNLHFNILGDPTYKTAQDWFDVIQSSGILDGFVLSNSRTATELDVSAGKGIIKETDSELGATVSFETGDVENITLTSDNINYIYVDYNSGTPQIIATTNRGSIELNRHFEIGRVYKNGTTLHILNAGVHISNLARSEHERLVERDGFTYVSGSIVSETGTLNLDVTAGVWFLGHNRLTTNNLNTDTGDDAWIYTHYGAASWITDNATTSGVDCTHYNAGTDALGTLGTNNYSTQWIYITADNDWYIIYGTQNGQLTAAEDASPPTLIPTYIATMGELIAKMIVKEDGTIVDIQSVHDITFTSAGVPNHNETGGIQGGTANEYYHLTSTQHVDLTDGGDSTSHKHDDRYYTESEVDTISGSLNTKIDGKIANLSEDAAPELGGQLGVGELDIKLDTLLSADGKYSGITRDGVLGATLAYGDLVYLNTTDQRWELADADAETTSGDVDLAIVLAGGDDGDTRLLLTDGYVREDDWNFTSYGQALFVSVTAGDMTQTAPVGSGDIVRVVGKSGTTANEIRFKPSETWIELS